LRGRPTCLRVGRRQGASRLTTQAIYPVREERSRPDQLWRNTEFLRLWLEQTVSSVGSGIVKLAAPLLVLALTESPAMAGLVGGALTFPMIFLGRPAGALVDRWDRRRVMIACDVTRCLAVATVPLAWLLSTLSAWHLLGVALAWGSAQSFFNIAQVAALPRVVTRRQIASAHALNTTSEGVALLTSPGIGGMIVAAGPTVVAGGVMAYGINGLTFIVSILALIGITTPFQARRSSGGEHALIRSIVEGLRYVMQERPIRLLMVLNMFHRLFFAPVLLTVVVLARQDLGLDPAAIGLLFSTAGAGGLTAAAVTP
jgi:MFS family permease